MKVSASKLQVLLLAVAQHTTQAFTVMQHDASAITSSSLRMAGGDGSDSEWSKALFESSGEAVRDFENDMKMKGLMKGTVATNPKLTANQNLVDWLTAEGNVYLSEQSSWGEAPHPLAISTETKDEITNESSGRGLLARRDINDGDELLKIPMKLCITKSAARKALGRDVLPSGINEYLAMACLLIHEKFVMAEMSLWKPYIDVLPEVNEVSPTFMWTDADLNFLEGSPVIAATKSMQMKVRSVCQVLAYYLLFLLIPRVISHAYFFFHNTAKLRREYDDLLGGPDGLIVKFPDRFPADKFTFEHWQWAFTMLFSRAIRLRSLKQGETLALVPYADLINHSPFSQAYIDARESGDWVFKSGEEEVILYADRGYRRMEQVYISYGPKSNAELLLLYGFAVERNPFNSVDVTVSIAPRTASFVKELNDDNVPVDPLADEKVAFLESVGRDKTVDFPCYADRYPVEMLEFLRLMQMTPDDTRGKALSEFDYSRTISSANEAAVLTSVIEAVKRQLGMYPQKEDEDAEIIKDKSLFRLLSYNQRMAVRHRRNEKRLLKRTIAALEKQFRQQGLDVEGLSRAEGSTLGKLLPGDERRYGLKQKTELEDRLDKLGLPVDLK